MQQYKENDNKTQTNPTIPIENLNGTQNPNNPNSEIYKETQKTIERKGRARVRSPINQPNAWRMFRRDGYIGLQILIIILTLATILGIIIGANIYIYTK